MGSRIPGSLFTDPFVKKNAAHTPGPLGMNDFAELRACYETELLGDTPGPLGLDDYGQQVTTCTPSDGAAPPAATTTSDSPQGGTGPLQVSAGQITFDAEGNDIDSNPYFSRHIHWPGGASGVTIGRGYDMKERSESAIVNDLVGSGLDSELAKKFAKGAGLKGVEAQEFVKHNRADLGDIPREVQKQLFERIYPKYVEKAKANYNKWTTGSDGKPLAGKVEWDSLNAAIRDILVDFVYQGFTHGANPMVKGMKNSFDDLVDYIKNNATLQQYEQGRHRAAYLQARKPK